MALDTEFDPFESELELGHTRNSYKLGTFLKSSARKIQVVALVVLGIQVGPEALSVKEKRVVPRQHLHPQVPYEVGRILVVVVHLLSNKKEINDTVSYKQSMRYEIIAYIHWTRINETKV